jgi:hypothetical protein
MDIFAKFSTFYGIFEDLRYTVPEKSSHPNKIEQKDLREAMVKI